MQAIRPQIVYRFSRCFQVRGVRSFERPFERAFALVGDAPDFRFP
jgi:hypothetical protein